ncbi:MAG: peptidoglycan DD-metalloendopeptidase family protein, partial [Solirubrobacterales bacterium]
MRRRRDVRAGARLALLALAFGAIAAAQPAPAEAGVLGKRTLSSGMRGKDVRILQRNLTKLKLQTKATGVYNRQTRKNVRRLERQRDWRVDGRVHRRQAKKINRITRKRARNLAAGSQVFPVPGAHDYGGPQARFGAGRSGHSHQGQDVFAACGEPLVSAQAGNVKVSAYQGSGAGHYLVITGVDGIDYVYMHLQKASWATTGAWV